jgi:CYTH domain-containing protein
MMRGAADEALMPKYAHIERERRWLVDPARRPPLNGLPPILIEDRYLAGMRFRLRRMTDCETGAQALKLTKKYDTADPLARPIVTAYLTEAEYEVYGRLDGLVVDKRRYTITEGGMDFSLDVFAGRLAGLELAEIEWPDDAGLRAISPPAWAIREVSVDARYQGGSLAEHGIPED